MEKDLVLIYSLEHGQYWRANSCGYTSDRETAGRYTRDEAKAICKVANNSVPVGEQLNEVIEEIDLNKKSNDSISKADLRAWCEEQIAIFKGNNSIHQMFRGIFELILEKFCGGEV